MCGIRALQAATTFSGRLNISADNCLNPRNLSASMSHGAFSAPAMALTVPD